MTFDVRNKVIYWNDVEIATITERCSPATLVDAIEALYQYKPDPKCSEEEIREQAELAAFGWPPDTIMD